MLFLAWIGALCCYIILYVLWEALQSHLSGATALLAAVNSLVTVPQNEALMLLHGLLLCTFLYIVADAILSPGRKLLRRKPRASKNGQKPPAK